MSKQTVLNNDSGIVARTKLNDNFTELYNGKIGAATLQLTLTVGGWSTLTQTLTATGITATNTVIVSPANTIANVNNYANANIICTAQGSNSLTFTCSITPTSDIAINIIYLI